jgi:NADP-dependent 3-hydroxy acid dehydrogenase YdfG
LDKQQKKHSRAGLEMKLEGKVEVVTGARSGIGQAVSLALVELCIKPILFGRSRDKLTETAQLNADKGRTAEIVAGGYHR